MVGDILQPTHLLFVLVVALLVLGPKRLPEVGQKLGSGLRDFRSAINGESTSERPAREEPETIYAPPEQRQTVVDDDSEEPREPAIAVESAPAEGDAPPPLSVAPGASTETRA